MTPYSRDRSMLELARFVSLVNVELMSDYWERETKVAASAATTCYSC